MISMVREKELFKKLDFIPKPSINNHNKIVRTYADSLNYLKKDKSGLEKEIALHFLAYYEIGDLIPQTLDNVGSGHYFPYSESYSELENSYELCLEGFYSYAFAALRSVLELGIMGIFFSVNDKEVEEVRPWITSNERTPAFRKALKRLKEIPCFKEFDNRFRFTENVLEIYDHLSGFIHTRGYKYSSRSKNRCNFNNFNEKALMEYLNLMFSVVSNLIVLMIIKYPIGIRPLPLSEKFGLNPSSGGFLEFYKISYIKAVIGDDKTVFLEDISNNNSEVQGIVNEIESLPDLSDEELEEQFKLFDKLNKQIGD